MTNEDPGRQLDHATARIVSELAAALLPSLREAVGSELEKTADAISARTNLAAREALEPLKRLQAGAETLDSVLDTLKDSAGSVNSARASQADLLAGFSQACVRLEASAGRLSDLADFLKNSRLQEAQVHAAQPKDAQFQKAQLQEAQPQEAQAQEVRAEAAQAEAGGLEAVRALRSLETAVFNWEGVLRADGRARTKEFSEFAAEVSDSMKDMRVTLPAVIREAAGKALNLRGEELARVTEQGKALEIIEKRLERFARVLTVGGIAFSALLAALFAAVAMALSK